MSLVRISIRDLFRGKASEKKAEETTKTETTTEKTEETTETTDESEEDESEEETEESTEETTTETTTTEASEKGRVQVKEMSLAAYNQLVADANAWNAAKDRYNALVQWEAAIKGVGGKGAAVDQNTQGDKTKGSVLDQPWNKTAMKAAGKGE